MKVAGLIFPLLLSFHASAELVDKTVAIVGTKVILKSDVDEVLAHPMSGVKTREDALAALIDKDVIQEDCKQSGNYPSDSEIKQTISEVKKQNHFDDATFSAALQRSGTDLAAYTSQLGVELCKSRVVHSKIRPRVNITDDDVKRAYDKSFGENSNYKLHLRDMRVSTKQAADQIATQLRSGKKWDAVVAEVKKIGVTVVSEDLGVLARSDLLASISDMVFAKGDDRFRGPVQTDEGFHVLEILEKVEGPRTPLADVRNDLHKQLFEKEVERLLKQYVDEAKSSVYIDVIGTN